MTELMTILRERIEEFNVHSALAISIQNRIFDGGEQVAIGSVELNIRHLLTMKSGMVIHLYNIVESAMTRAKRMVSTAFCQVPPKNLSDKARREWLRVHGVIGTEGSADRRLERMQEFSVRLLSDSPLGGRLSLAKPRGSWNDGNIGEFAHRLGMTLHVDVELRRKLGKQPILGDKTPMSFIADRRDDLGHGKRTFEEGARELTPQQIQAIAETVFEYMELVVNSFESYLDQKHFVAAS